MARLNQFAFAGQLINGPNIRIGQITGQFGLPPLRGANWIAQNATGEQFVPKLHGGRDIILPLIVRDIPNGISQSIFDKIAGWAATRTQSTLANILDTGTRTAMAECTGFTQTDMTQAGLTFAGLLTFHLADPWFYGPAVTGSVTPTGSIGFGAATYQYVNPGTTSPVVMTGVVSGQPILLEHLIIATGLTTTISDSFAGHYTWTMLETQAGANTMELWIGTGGSGTSGTITISWGGGSYQSDDCAVSMVNASTAAGAAAVDVHTSGQHSSPPASLAFTPAVGYEAAFAFLHCGLGTAVIGPTGWSNQTLGPSGTQMLSELIAPPAGVQLIPAWTIGAYIWWMAAGGVMKNNGAVGTALNITNPGTVTAEKLTLDILGPITNPQISNATTGTSVSYTGTVAAGQHLLLDVGNFTATNNGTNVIGSVLHSGATPFLTLAPGVNGLTIYGVVTGGSPTLTVSFAPPYE